MPTSSRPPASPPPRAPAPVAKRAPAAEALDVPHALLPYLALVEGELAARVPFAPHHAVPPDLNGLRTRLRRLADGPVIFEPIRHVIAAGGKRLRPVLTLIAAEAICGDRKRALPTAAGIELLHTFTLVHDDVMDNDLTRRGRPTVHALWGGPVAIVAGDGLYALAFRAIADNARVAGVDPATIVDVTRRAAEVSFDLCEGQTRDVLFEADDDVDLAAYHDMIRLKTGILIALAVEAGAKVAGAGPQEVEALAAYGLNLGLAFQVKDDLLDLVGDERELGKPVGSDIRAGKKTYPVLHALLHLPDAGRKRLLQILHAPEKETTATMVAEALRLIEQSGGLAAADAHALRLADEAKRALLPLRTARAPVAVRLLEAVADYVVERRR